MYVVFVLGYSFAATLVCHYEIIPILIGVCLAHPPDSTKEICYGDLVTEIL